MVVSILLIVVVMIVAGYPLAETDLTPQPELAEKIRQWILMKSLNANSGEMDTASNVPTKPNNDTNDDLYDF
jgi:hypothetical protein